MGFLQLKVFGIDHRIIWGIFIVIQALIFSCMLATIGTEMWIKVDSNGFFFEGSLFEITDSNSLEEESYKDYRSDYCDLADLDGSGDTIQAYCDTFKNLENGGLVYVILEAISLAGLVCWIVGLLLFMFKKNSMLITLGVSVFVCITHLVAYLTFMILCKVNYNDDCDEFLEDGDKPPKLCAMAGAELSLFVTLILPVLTIVFFIVGFAADKNSKNPSQKISQDNQNVQMMNQPHDLSAKQGGTQSTQPGYMQQPGTQQSGRAFN